MKKLFVLVAFLTTVYTMGANAQQQGGGDPSGMLQRYKERVKPQLIEKAKLTEAQADQVIEISFKYRSKMRGLRDLNEDDRKKMMEELDGAQNKEIKAIPLTDDQAKAVSELFEELRKQQRKQNSGGNGN